MWYINRSRSIFGNGRFLRAGLFLSALRDRVAYSRFFVLERDIFIRTALLVLCKALVGEAIGKRNSIDLRIVIRRTNELAAGMALVITTISWIGDMMIIRLFTNQTALTTHAKAHWLWACLPAPASFMAYQLDGIFVGATRGQDMRNPMIFSAGGLVIALLLLAPWSLQGLLAAFVGYLGLRGASLWWNVDRVYALAGPSLQQR